jgi:large subunit ribosomal protein L9
MKVVLRNDVQGVGRRGDIVEVTCGFARNFLLPQGQAIVATDGVDAQAEAMRRGRDLREARDRQAAEAQVALLSGAVVTVQARAGSGGRLFGSVTAADLVDAVRQQKGVELDRRHVNLDEPIKSLGTREVSVALFEDITAAITVEVVAAG